MRSLKLTLLIATILLSQISFAATQLTENWMKNIPSNRVMDQLIIPGSHDSGTYDIDQDSYFSYSKDAPIPLWLQIISNLAPKSVVRKISANWSKTQPLNLTNQLNSGVRYLDIRVCRENTILNPNKFYLCHTQLSDSLANGLDQVINFVKSHPSEIVIFDVNHLINMESSKQEATLLTLLQHKLSALTVPNTLSPNSTIGALRSTHKQIILYVKLTYPVIDHSVAPFVKHMIWPSNEISSPWPAVANIKDLKTKLDTDIAFHSQNMKTENRFFVIQAIQTEDANTVIDGILHPKTHPNSIEAYETPVNQQLSNWINEYLAQYHAPVINIVIQDWVKNNSSMIMQAIAYDLIDQGAITARKEKHVVSVNTLNKLQLKLKIITRIMRANPGNKESI